VVDELQSGTVTRTYSYGLERISEMQPINSTLTTSFYGYDGHGSVRQLANSAGAVTDTYDYDAFGNLINSTGSTPNNYLFAGEQYDPALSLYYNRARYLNTTTGRFWSMDLFEGHTNDPATLHKYLYVQGNPVNKIDHCGYCVPSNSGWGDIVQRDVFRQYSAYTGGWASFPPGSMT
jgi:RHS repeat-associated protein